MLIEKKKYYGLVLEIICFSEDVLDGSAFTAGDWDDEGFEGPTW